MRLQKDSKCLVANLSQFKYVVPECWTDWFDRDNPTGTGDWETLNHHRYENPGKVCPKPVDIEARTLSGLTATAAGDVIYK